MSAVTSCLDENTLAEFVDGLLAPDAAARAEHHMRECSACRQAVAALAAGLSRTSPPPELSEGLPAGEGATPAWLARGTKLGRYVILRPLGAGGMGVVYAASDPELARKVSIKLMRADVVGSKNSEGRARLQREAQAMARLSHPNVITVFDVGTFNDQVFVAMEYVDGGTLAQWLREKPRSWREVLGMFVLSGRGLAAAHAAGLVHRDFKPDNVLIGRDGRVRVTDFGLARATGQQPLPSLAGASVDSLLRSKARPGLLDSPLTLSGAIVGTPAYMAPEQIEGLPSDARTDQFSFCVALYEGLYGERPFQALSVTSLATEMKRGPAVSDAARKAQVPAWLYRILLKGVSAHPAQRFASMDELLAAIAQGSQGGRRRWLAASSGVALLAGLTLWGAWALGPRNGARTPAPAQEVAAVAARPSGQASPALPVARLDAPENRGSLPSKEAAKPPRKVAAKSEQRAPVSPATSAPAATAPAKLSLHVFPWADIEVDGKVVARGKMDFEMEIPSGAHRLTLKNPYCLPHEESVELGSGQVVEKRVRLTRLEGKP